MVFILLENALSNQLDIVIIINNRRGGWNNRGGGGGGGLEGVEKIVYAVSQYLYVKVNTTLFFFNKRALIPYTILYKKTKKGWNLRKLRNLII